MAHQPIGIRTDFIESILEPLFLTWYLDRLRPSTLSGFCGTRGVGFDPQRIRVRSIKRCGGNHTSPF